MEVLNLPDFSSQLQINRQQRTIFDPFRKKHVALTPEEWVRQNFLLYLCENLAYPKGLIRVEMSLNLNDLNRRCDAVVYDKSGLPKLIVECKAASVKITQKAFDQIATYNLKLKVDFLILTNGLNHYCCKMNYETNNYTFLEAIPNYQDLLK